MSVFTAWAEANGLDGISETSAHAEAPRALSAGCEKTRVEGDSDVFGKGVTVAELMGNSGGGWAEDTGKARQDTATHCSTLQHTAAH